MPSGPVPVLVKVTDWAAVVVPTLVLLNVNDVEDSVTAGEPVPVPETGIKCGLVGESSTMVNVPVRLPTVVGENFTEI